MELKSKIQELETENKKLKEKDNLYESHIDDENFEWINIKNWDKVIISNPVTNKKVEITENELFKMIDLREILYPLTIHYVASEWLPNVQPYVFDFIKGDSTYRIEVKGHNIIEFKDKYYNVSEGFYRLGNALLFPPTYMKVDNILSKMYYSSYMIEKTLNFNNEYEKTLHSDIGLIHAFPQYIEKGISKGDLVIIDKLPKGNVKLVSTLEFYWHGNIIIMNIYDYNDIESKYIEIIDNEKKIIYEQKNKGNIRLFFGM
ncbi:hypothetical protein Y919_03220 [Caloranaerobacter azorensis H53214]|uniref:Uncharacterized protein n=1 Tax=Caloranaerobacter azorensis H53214 TaxID=1156417 RepID=A0A096CWQ7_9FIRM|nr:hypothetical protein [Caloranaerobacter azorensis]KGG80994.1 hypothetical protein Y919_03220 [Caloranaerobacter azorensis H53214]